MFLSFNRLSIRYQVVLLAVAMALPVAAMFAWLLVTQYQRASADGYADAKNTASQTAARVAQKLQDHENWLSRIAERPLFRAMDPRLFDPHMSDIMQLHPELNNLAVRDLQGGVVYSFRPNGIGAQAAQSLPWFQEALRAKKFSASDAFHWPLFDRWVSVLTFPLRNPQGEVSGLVLAPLDLLHFNERLFPRLSYNAMVTVVDRHGAVLLRSRAPDTWIGKPVPAQGLQTTTGLQEGVFSTADSDGVPSLSAFTSVTSVGWRVVVSIPNDVVFAGYRQAFYPTLLAGLVLLFLTLALALRLGSAIVRPVSELSDTVASIAAGNRSARANPLGPPEIAAVALHLNTMLDAQRRDADSLLHSEAFSLAILNSVSSEIAVLDRNGVIVAVNEPWKRFAMDNAQTPQGTVAHTGVGSNYLQVCEPIVDTHIDQDAAHARQGIQAVLSGSIPSFYLEYPCHSPLQQRWFSMSATPLMHADGGVVVTHTEVTQRKQAEETLRQQTETLLAVIHSASDAVISVDVNGRISLFNPAAERIFGYHAGAMIGRPLESLLPERLRANHQSHLQGFAHSQVARRPMGAGLVQGLAADGRELELEASISQVIVRGRKVLTASLRDVTERVHAEGALRASLREKDALLREVHHRVKNNLQVITSLLRLEAGRNEHVATKAVLMDMKGRIFSMALLHESLYRTGIFAAVDLSAYLRQLATQAFRTQATPLDRIRLHLELDPMLVEMDQATPCGLLVNELISNCFKHGFPEGRSGEVQVQLHAVQAGPQVRLVVSDNGVGLPADFEIRRTQSLGLQLVTDLARQLGGTLKIGPGSSFAVTFTPHAVHPSAQPS